MTEVQPETLSEAEQSILRQLLSRDFPGRDVLMRQVETARVRRIKSDGSPALQFILPPGVERAPVEQRTPLEAEGVAMDADGVSVQFVLHVVDGLLHELEVFREDGAPMFRMPDPARITPAY